ncbi:hypothetical protein ACF059_21485 [Streptomyces sp. NPDC016562]|uniref:hypothetical protein n=1 Tax=Streptomyces sp. NPDC016562 TaxID=3364966 RepID=UPI0036F777EA
MSDIVKYLPEAAIPGGGAPQWEVADAERWRAARVPAVFGPAAGGWILAALVLLAVVVQARGEHANGSAGTSWTGYPGAVLLFALPAWYRFLPAAAVVAAAPLVALDAVRRVPAPDGPGPAAGLVLVALSALALCGALLRLRARRRQRALVLAAAAGARSPVPEHLPDGHRRRGLRLVLAGGALCLAAGGLLVWGLVQDLGAAREAPYDAAGQQLTALLLLVTGTPLLGRGLNARRAALRLHDGPQPVLRVGVRHHPSGRHWLFADARTVSARPLVAFRDRFTDNHPRPGRILVGGSPRRLRREHHDIDERSEPFEAVMYGAPCEGAEVLLEFALYEDERTIVSHVTAAPLLPHRRHSFRPWTPAGTSYAPLRRAAEERERARRAARRSRRSDGGSSACGASDGGGCGGCGGGGD